MCPNSIEEGKENITTIINKNEKLHQQKSMNKPPRSPHKSNKESKIKHSMKNNGNITKSKPQVPGIQLTE